MSVASLGVETVWVTILGVEVCGFHFGIDCIGGTLRVTILLQFYSVWPLFNLIIAINVSCLLYRALQTYEYVYNNTFDDRKVSEGLYMRVFILFNYHVYKVEGSE